MLSRLYNQSLIPSRRGAYSARAHYKNPPVFGSLTLGGYDTTRFSSNSLSFAFGADDSRDLLVSLQSVTYDTAGSSPLLTSSINVFIDSLVTAMWLPVPVCEAFAQQFNLTWNEQGQLYLISNTVHAVLLTQNPTFTFKIGHAGADGAGNTVDIVLPYAAFDLNLTAPIVGRDARYFPLKQAQNSTQYTLGRTFLQEAYVIADYERHNFSVSQALFPSTSIPAKIVSIYALEKSDGTVNNDGKRGLGAGIIAGIAVAAIATLAFLGAAIFLCSRYKKKRYQLAGTGISRPEAQETNYVANLMPDGTKLEVEDNKVDVHEVAEQHCLPSEMPGNEPEVHEMNEQRDMSTEPLGYDDH
ncbi:hypothetical protein VTL71DRAFT_4663 [Oculimacula yallundae]|uniref:Peptidase A1 domain-containing protein n=1 Tax=Oculimacula yallundae TaxID=86028 RepID=A0ABR4C2N5_9HELO